ncbi:MAG: NAD(P)H-binding protein, partial [Roseiflexaceae bacterium]
MHILIIGASGGIGQQVVTQALARGHLVSVFVRQPRPWPSHVTIHFV